MKSKANKSYPLLATSIVVPFPYNSFSFPLASPSNLNAVTQAMKEEGKIFLGVLKQSGSKLKEKGVEEIYQVGCICTIKNILRIDGELQLFVDIIQRGKIIDVISEEGFASAVIEEINEVEKLDKSTINLMKHLRENFSIYTKRLNGSIQTSNSLSTISTILKAEYPHKLIDLICGVVKIPKSDKIDLLQIIEAKPRLEELSTILQTELEMNQISSRIQKTVKEKLEKKQKEYYLNEQIKEINKELGKSVDEACEFEQLAKALKEKNLPDEVYQKATKELNRLQNMQSISPEAGILRYYIDWIIDLPWNEKTSENRDLKKAKEILDNDHYDLKKPKERILDFIAIKQLTDSAKGPILCFVGPPGTGKTSLGKSVAKALNREFVRISLGGIRDEAEIRGHRKTYIGAMPGKIIQSMKKAKTVNPLFLLDEIDKMSSDFRGDPSSALLEVLDSQQNHSFNDHYLEVPYDLSKVMFIATANSLHNIPLPLRDRMEVIEISGYSDYEKQLIATEFIIPKQLEENGLSYDSINFTPKAIKKIINNYTMESGVRNLERTIANAIRKSVRLAIEEGKIDCESNKADFPPITIDEKNVGQLLGVEKYKLDLLFKEPKVGNINGLAWTEVGGTLLPVEAITFDGKGELLLTGSLGDVMIESAKTAYSFIKSNKKAFGLASNFNENKDLHLHVPEGAIPKDGPSAGITIASAIYSAFSGKIPAKDFAMTGEITLTGRVLKIGGLKEKLLAALRNGIKQIILPYDNKKDVQEMPKEITSKLSLHYVKEASEVLEILFGPFVKPQKKSKPKEQL